MSRKRKILYGIVATFILIQFFRPGRNSGNAGSLQDISHFTDVSPELKNILETSCYDCHSDHTQYPWYTNIQPVGWWLNDHVQEGKEELNFSQFNTYRIKRKLRKFHEIAEQVNEKEMPLSSYTLMHGNAKLDEQQTKLLVDWAKENEKNLAALYPDSVNTK